MILYIGTNTIPVGPKGDSGSLTNIRTGNAIATGSLNQLVTFSSPLANANYSIQWNDFGAGLGIELVPGSKTINGFTINSNYSGNFDYNATLYQ